MNNEISMSIKKTPTAMNMRQKHTSKGNCVAVQKVITPCKPKAQLGAGKVRINSLNSVGVQHQHHIRVELLRSSELGRCIVIPRAAATALHGVIHILRLRRKPKIENKNILKISIL
jgi:hypothetical protein